MLRKRYPKPGLLVWLCVPSSLGRRRGCSRSAAGDETSEQSSHTSAVAGTIPLRKSHAGGGPATGLAKSFSSTYQRRRSQRSEKPTNCIVRLLSIIAKLLTSKTLKSRRITPYAESGQIAPHEPGLPKILSAYSEAPPLQTTKKLLLFS